MSLFSSVSQDSWDHLTEVAAGMVAVGVILEFVDLRKRYKERNTSILPKQSICMLLVECVSIFLVVFGIVLETYSTYRSGEISRQIIIDLNNKNSALEAK
jgi:hypothetical protein